MKTGALDGYRVLDLADEKGILCTRLLADSGADVIRIEQPGNIMPPDYLNAGKRHITLNPEKDRGREIFRRLVRNTDVLVESYRPGYLAGLELDFPVLSKINPRLVMASITDFGQTGPYRDYLAGELVASALGGQMYVTGAAERPPLKLYGHQPNYTASLFAVAGILLALWNRHNTGKGQYLDISMQDCAAATLDHVLVRYFSEGIVSGRQGGQHWNGAFRIFPCRDGYVLLSLFQHWETLVEWLETEGMAGDLADEQWRDDATRRRNIDHITSILERWTGAHTADELAAKGQMMGFPWAKVTAIPELLRSPQMKERGFFSEVIDPATGKRFTCPGAPFKMGASPLRPGTSLPRHGEHTAEFLGAELGLSPQELQFRSREGVI